MNDILVSVAVITYGQEKYIEKALDSILMQKVNFKFEVIIGEDCSPDNTRKILLEYKEKCPHTIKLILHNKNIGATKNLYEVLIRCKGKYITLLECDDYWEDPLKLQKQVDFLSNNNKYTGVGCRTINIDQSDDVITRNFGKSFPGEDFTMELYLKGYSFVGVTLMFGNIFLDKINNYDILWKANRYVSDTILNTLLLDLGPIRVLDDCMYVHRIRVKKGELNYNSLIDFKQKMIDQVHVTIATNNYFLGRYNFTYKFINKLTPLFIYCIKRGLINEFMYELKSIPRKAKLKFWLSLPINMVKIVIDRFISFRLKGKISRNA